MILRKPYAFLIKHFHLIHVILGLLVGYLIYKTGLILSFLNEYMGSGQALIERDLTTQLFNIWMFFFPFLIILFTTIIMGLLYNKKKPIAFYFVNIIISIAILVVYNITYGTLETLETSLLDLRTIRMMRDLLFATFIGQCIAEVIIIIRATGFDLKKFDFGHDLEELEITEEDNEEFELSINIDTDRLNRGWRRNLRFARYIYIENKFIIDILILIGISMTCFIVYINVSIYNKKINQAVAFSTDAFNMIINRSYVTSEDYKGNILSNGKSLVVLEISIKSRFKEQQLSTVNTQLVIDKKKYYPTITYRDEVFDLGPTYQDSMIGKNFEKYLLVYEIPRSEKNKKMMFMFDNTKDIITSSLERKYIKVELAPKHLDNNQKKETKQVGNAINLNDSILKNSTFFINSYAIQKEYKETYQFCPIEGECYASYEYIKPAIVNTYPKTLLKLEVTLNLDKELIVQGLYNPYTFINYFGTVKYTLNGEEKTQDINFRRVKPIKANQKNIYYIEILEEIEQAEKVSIYFHIRNRDYEYVLK